MSEMGDKIHHMLLMVRIDDLSENMDNTYPYSRVRLTDFDINYQFDKRKIGKELNLADLRGGEGQGDDGGDGGDGEEG